ncbi:unnamed protein product [Effrenium voratum]|uniref:Uncharacterized protein n=1 Tax=Effrenium voratum TaxID=2562239 RepID=A0AA36NIE9_9DINO|nr:unnamed protein product [Effrenium voratum]CAJ1417507.1 unnamed protein product [Effrenium voratum]
MCEALGASALSLREESAWWSSAAAVALWACIFHGSATGATCGKGSPLGRGHVVILFHVLFLAAAARQDVQMRKQGWWKEEYFLTRDAAHAQVLKLSPAARLQSAACGACRALRSEGFGGWLQRRLAAFCVRASAASKLQLAELDVEFMLLHMYQVTFSSEESAWTRKRNADFLALQLKVQQAVTVAYQDFVSKPSLCSRFWVFLVQLQPHCAVQSYSLVTRCLMRACVVVANVSGRVAMSVVFFLVLQDTQPRDHACASEWRHVNGIVSGIGVQLLFSCVSRMLQLLWTAVLLLCHSREFKQDEWDAASRQRQLWRWWLQDMAFAGLVVLYAASCATLGAAYIASSSDEDGQRWLVSLATVVLLSALLEPLLKSLLASILAGWCLEDGISLQECLGAPVEPRVKAANTTPVADLGSIREGDEAPPAPRIPASIPRAPSAPAQERDSPGKGRDVGLAPTIHAWRSSPNVLSTERKVREQPDSWRRRSDPELDQSEVKAPVSA